jgi:cell division protease FtsH
MENLFAQEDDLPPTGGPKKSRTRSRRPVWFWLILLVGFALIFWQFVPKTHIQVEYNPWFLDRVKEDNVKSVVFEGVEIHGELRIAVPLGNDPLAPGSVRKFYTYAPSEASIYPLELALRENGVRIVASPPKNPVIAWFLLTIAVVGFISLVVMQRVREQFDKNSP